MKKLTLLFAFLTSLTGACKMDQKKASDSVATETAGQINGITKKWWKEDVVYQVYPRSFKDSNGDGIGDLQGLTQKLDYLKNLGVGVIWLGPHFKSPNVDNGYDISDYRDIMTEFGTMQDFDALLAGVKQRGMKLILDLVVNHTSDQHQWFVESRKSKTNPYRDYYIWRPAKNGKEPNNWTSGFSGSAWKLDTPTNEYYLHLFAVQQPDLNWDNPKVRKEVFDVMKFWLDKGVDGFRMDVIPFISKNPEFPDLKPGEDFGAIISNGPHVHDYLQEMNREVLSKYNMTTVGEASGVSLQRTPDFIDERRHELNMIFQFDIVNTIDRAPGWKHTKPWKIEDFKAVFTKYETQLDKHTWNTVFFGNHDNPRIVSRFGSDLPEYRAPSAKMLATMLFTLKGTPFVYQGDELGMTNYAFKDMKDVNDVEARNAYTDLVLGGKVDTKTYIAELNKTGRDNARTPMQWDASPNAGFTTAAKPWLVVNPNYKEINAAQETTDTASIYNYYRKMIELRKNTPALIYGDYKDLDPAHPQVFIYTRSMEGKKILVLLNFSNKQVDYTLPQSTTLKTLLATNVSGVQMDKDDKGNIKFHLTPYQASVYEIN